MLTLVISHNVCLRPEEIKILLDGGMVETVGVSVPVWFHRGNTSEPAQEIFCKYKLTNFKEDYPISILIDGYQVNLPQRKSLKSKLKSDDWNALTIAEQEDWKQKNPICITPSDLAHVSNTNPFYFKKYHKIREEAKQMNIIHSVEIGTYEMLEKSLY